MFKLYITIKNKYWIINNKFFWTPHFISRFYEFTDYYPCSLIWGWEQCFWCRSSLYWGWSKYLGEGGGVKKGGSLCWLRQLLWQRNAPEDLLFKLKSRLLTLLLFISSKKVLKRPWTCGWEYSDIPRQTRFSVWFF